jgi:hypothetical protein
MLITPTSFAGTTFPVRQSAGDKRFHRFEFSAHEGGRF